MNITQAREKGFIIGILGLVLIEFFTTMYLQIADLQSTRVVGYYKLFLLAFLIGGINIKKVPKAIIVWSTLFFVMFTLNQCLNPLYLNYSSIKNSFLNGGIYYFIKYTYFIFAVAAFYSLEDKTKVAKSILNLVEILILINSLFVLIGLFSNIELFRSYPYSDRFGYNGLFNKTNEVSFLYIIILANGYYKFLKNGKVNWLRLIYITLISALLGTKTVWLFISMAGLFHILVQSKIRKKVKYIIIGSLFLAFTFIDKILTFLFSMSPFWNQFLEKHSIVSLVFSLRDQALIRNMEYISENWDLINFFIGGAFYTQYYRLTEMDGPDLFLFFGTIGTVVYFMIFGMIFMKKNNLILNGLIIIILICGLFGGALLMSSLCMILMFLVSFNLNKKYKD